MAVCGLAFVGNAHAAACFYANLYQTDRVPQWGLTVDTSDPGGPTSCLDNGQTYSTYLKTASTPPEVIATGPPFSGSASRTHYFSACYDDSHYIVVEMKISLSSCAMWVCTTNRSYKPLVADCHQACIPPGTIQSDGSYFRTGRELWGGSCARPASRLYSMRAMYV